MLTYTDFIITIWSEKRDIHKAHIHTYLHYLFQLLHVPSFTICHMEYHFLRNSRILMEFPQHHHSVQVAFLKLIEKYFLKKLSVLIQADRIHKTSLQCFRGHIMKLIWQISYQISWHLKEFYKEIHNLLILYLAANLKATIQWIQLHFVK